MTTGHKACGPSERKPPSGIASFKSFLVSLLVLAPAALTGYFLTENRAPLPSPYLIAYAILLWAVLDFIIVVLIEPYRRAVGKLTIPAFIGAISIVMLFVIAESLNRFFKHLGYSLLTPFVIAAVALIAVAVFREKNIVLKCYLSLNSIMLIVLWALGSADKITMPF
ncbi:MAG: hypothetical protein V1721_07230 [Pseudomonadota bacterium]